MKIDEISHKSLKQLSNIELSSLHRRIHQLIGVCKKRKTEKTQKLLEKLKEVHEIVFKEMSRRKFKHSSDLLEEKNMSDLISKLEKQLLEEIYQEQVIPSTLQKGERLLLEAKKKKRKFWIQKAIERPGALHAALGIPKGEKIPAEKLKIKPSDSPKLKKMKILAKTLRKIARKKAKK